MARNVKLRTDDLHELLQLTDTLQTESGKRLREWIAGELMRREKSGRLGGRTRRDGGPRPEQRFIEPERAPIVDRSSVIDDFDFGA